MPIPDWFLYAIAVFGGILAWRDLRWGLTAIAIAIGVSPEYRTAVAKDLRLEDFLIAAVVLAWFLQKRMREEPLIPETPLNRILALWVLTGALSVAFGSVLGTLPSLRLGLLHLFKRIELIFLFWMVADQVRSLADVRWITVSGLVGAMLSSFVGWHQHWMNPPREGVHWNAYKVMGPPGEKSNVYAQYLVFNALVGFALALSLYPSPAMWLPLTLVGLATVPILFSFSRSAMAAYGVGALSLMAVFQRRWLPFLFLFALFLPALLPSDVERRLQMLSWEHFKVERLGGYIAAVRETFRKNPITGHGLGFAGFNRYENQYANTLGREGILGLIVFLGLLWTTLRMHGETLREARDPYLRGIVQGCFAGTIAFCIAGLSGVPMLAIRPSEAFWFWTGVTAGVWRLAVLEGAEDEGEREEGAYERFPP